MTKQCLNCGNVQDSGDKCTVCGDFTSESKEIIEKVETAELVAEEPKSEESTEDFVEELKEVEEKPKKKGRFSKRR